MRFLVGTGLDGVEIHAANNYLIDTFLRNGTNRRDDAYGGTSENRVRFLIEIVDSVSRAIGPDRVGVRLSPTNAVHGISDSAPEITFPTAARMLNRFGLAYLHVIEPEPGSGHPMATDLTPVAPLIRAAFDGPLILNGVTTATAPRPPSPPVRPTRSPSEHRSSPTRIS